jgi:hypothetical protein
MKLMEEMLITPIIFIYPEFGQFDYIEQASEDIKIWEIFQQVFESGLPWDVNQYYTDNKTLKYFVMVN